MSDSEQNQSINTNADLSVPFKAQITLISIVLIFVFFILLLVFYLRSRGRYIGSLAYSPSRRLIFAPPPPSALRRALDPAILNSLPITIFRSEVHDQNDCLECAVCLCDLSDGEKVRFLPKCSHGFHVECIDMWFHSNNTCPLCRNLVTETSIEAVVNVQQVSEDRNSVNASDEGTSSASTSTSTSASSSTSSLSRKRKEGMLVIDIPRGTRMSNGPLSSSSRMPSESPLPTSRLLEDIKSPGLGKMGRMRSFRRMLSSVSFKGVVGSSSKSPRGGGDIEQGEVSDSKRQ